ncbi:MAG: hypothetical protein HY553_07770 [Elusimicrobia bacterium]|nr:hypothetical protein [Elusimicrobiota bacterium]
MKTQCEAMTSASTYSEAHRCLKPAVLRKAGKRLLCAHHRNMEARRTA